MPLSNEPDAAKVNALRNMEIVARDPEASSSAGFTANDLIRAAGACVRPILPARL